MIYGKVVSNWLWSTYGAVLFTTEQSTIIFKQSYSNKQYSSCLLVCLLVSVLIASVYGTDKGWGDSRLCKPFLTCLMLMYITHTNTKLCLDAIAHIQEITKTTTPYYYVVAIVDSTHIG